MTPQLSNLEQLLDLIAASANTRDRVSLGSIVESIGSRSFGPILLLTGLTLISPLSGIPGLPSTMALLIILVTAQMLLRRKHFWLPGWMLRRSIKHYRLTRTIKWLRPSARFIDQWLRPRLLFLVKNSGTFLIAILCTIIASVLPATELVPFSSSIAGVALALFGLALVAHDGLLVIAGLAVTAGVAALLIIGVS